MIAPSRRSRPSSRTGRSDALTVIKNSYGCSLPATEEPAATHQVAREYVSTSLDELGIRPLLVCCRSVMSKRALLRDSCRINARRWAFAGVCRTQRRLSLCRRSTRIDRWSGERCRRRVLVPWAPVSLRSRRNIDRLVYTPALSNQRGRLECVAGFRRCLRRGGPITAPRRWLAAPRLVARRDP